MGCRGSILGDASFGLYIWKFNKSSSTSFHTRIIIIIIVMGLGNFAYGPSITIWAPLDLLRSGIKNVAIELFLKTRHTASGLIRSYVRVLEPFDAIVIAQMHSKAVYFEFFQYCAYHSTVETNKQWRGKGKEKEDK